MYITCQDVIHDKQTTFPFFKAFSIEDKEIIKSYVDPIRIPSCEYSFVNLFTWQETYKLSWAFYKGRLLIYDGNSNCIYMPLGEDLAPDELSILSMNLKNSGFSPDFHFVNSSYLVQYPEVSNYYRIEEDRNYAEYIYDINQLCELQGKKLHKKRNLIAQFKRNNPQFEIRPLTGSLRNEALDVARQMVNSRKRPPESLVRELKAIESAIQYFEELDLEGLALTVGGQMAAFSVFSRLGSETYDIHFEKSDMDFKGAAQVINQETAKYLRDKCIYLNREQDLGIKGLRQAKMSYEPLKILAPATVIFSPSN